MTKSLIYRSFYAFVFISSLISCQNDESEKIQPMPVIESISPESDYVEQTIIILGKNFGTNAEDVEVYFYDGALAEIVAISNTSISVVIPGDAFVGPVTVKVKSKEVTTETNFTVLQLCWNGTNLYGCPRVKP